MLRKGYYEDDSYIVKDNLLSKITDEERKNFYSLTGKELAEEFKRLELKYKGKNE